MEPQSQSIATYNYLKKQNLVTLICILALNLSCRWDALSLSNLQEQQKF